MGIDREKRLGLYGLSPEQRKERIKQLAREAEEMAAEHERQFQELLQQSPKNEPD